MCHMTQSSFSCCYTFDVSPDHLALTDVHNCVIQHTFTPSVRLRANRGDISLFKKCKVRNKIY